MIAFHTYGLIIGISLVVGAALIENKYKKLGYSEDSFYKISLTALVFSVIFARIWHVFTDFYLYKDNLIQAFYIWNGGLSIFGGILGGIIGIKVAKLIIKQSKKIKTLELLDVAVFGLPFGQAIGRLGNYVNQELYGKPTNLFWKIFIDKEHRIAGFEHEEYYHPLFFYEMILMFVFGLLIYYLDKIKKLPKIGQGKLFLIYVLYYSLVRFFLDFLRIDKAIVGNSEFGANQLILLIIIFYSLYLLNRKKNV